MTETYTRQVAAAFAKAEQFGDARVTRFELAALRKLHAATGRDRGTTLALIKEHGYPTPAEITPEMVALTGAAHACGVAIYLAETRGIEGKDSTYESYTAKNRFDRFTRKHLPAELRETWDAPLERQSDISPLVSYPESVSLEYVHGIGKPSRYLPAQTMLNLEFARLGKLDDDTKYIMGIEDATDSSLFAVDWDELIPIIKAAKDPVSLAGNLGAEVGRRLLENGLSPEKVAGFLNKSFSIRGIKAEHGNIPEADAVRQALIDSLAANPATQEVSRQLH